jgi:nitrate reductase NapAB chaperone NapD
MPVSGLILNLVPHDLRRCSKVMEILDADSRITVGDQVGGCLPIVTETSTMDEHEALWKELAALEGVLQVRMAFHDFSDVDCYHRPLRQVKGGRP